ncbi:MAG TPA: glycosyltransferase family 2 protein [Pseudolabrys sp.]|nr:glycosyltransferase family 2 protein [Pseudolabrys sp.]
MSGDLISIVVTTYRREDALDAVLRSLSGQTDKNFEVIVADDGSGPQTRVVIDSWKPRLPVRLEHVWHEDRGFRAAEIRNRAVLSSYGSYCIFLDGDCIARPDFVAEHRRLARSGCFVTGNRVLLSRWLTEAVLREQLAPETWSAVDWLKYRTRAGVNRVSALVRLPLGPVRSLRANVWQGARSCNLAVARRDFDAVDGFDAGFSGWGKEDSDIIVRLLHAGVRRRDGSFATGVIHLWHPEADRSQLAENERKLEELLEGRRIRAKVGLSSLSADAARIASGAGG